MRWMAAALAAGLVLAAAPAMAANAPAAATAPAYLPISQVPSVYAQKGIAPNLFLLLDDSGSMQFEFLGSKGSIGDYDYGFPPGSSEPYGHNTGTYCSGYYSGCAPGFEADDYHAAEYRAAYVNPNYYNPAVTYTPWACAAKYPESGPSSPAPTTAISPLPDFSSDCHWDAQVGLYVLPNADVNKVWLNPSYTTAGHRSLNVWNDAGWSDRYNQQGNNGYVGDSGQDGGHCYPGYDRGNRRLTVCNGQPVDGDLGRGDGYSGPTQGPSHGTVVIDDRGNFTYTPADPTYTGNDSFQYQRQTTKKVCDPPWGWWDCHKVTTTKTYTVTVEYDKTEPAGLWPATYFNYFGDMPGSNNDYSDTDNYQRVQICPSTPTTNSDGIVSTQGCTPPPTLPLSPESYHTYTDASGNYVYVQGDGTQILRTPAEALRNFANWYQYYRSHILATQAGIGLAFMQIPTRFRVDYGVINTMDDDKNGAEIKSTEDFTQAGGTSGLRYEFLNKLYTQNIFQDGTPNREALQSVGEWFGESVTAGVAPWGNSTAEKGAGNDTPLSCRANYVILATDGEWTGDTVRPGNVDGKTGPSTPASSGHAAYQYQPQPPFADNVKNTLADVAMKYWESDLQGTLANNVPTNATDAGFWQHLVTFTVGLGVTPSLVERYMQDNPGVSESAAQQAVFQDLKDGTQDWPSPCGSGTDANDCNGGSQDVPEKIDDTWHAAVDGRGTYASAGDPTALYKAINDALIDIVNRTGAASSLSVNTEKTGQTRIRQQVFQALFHPQNWWGDLLALPVVVTPANGTASIPAFLTTGTADWSGSCDLTGGACPQIGNGETVTVQDPTSRNIATWSGSTGVDFSTTGLAAAAQSAIGGADIVNYIRGVRTQEAGSSGTLRARDSVLGDIVRSSPVYVGKPEAQYSDTWANFLHPSATPPENSASEKYSDFVAAHASRDPVVYAGANDGMLHGFCAATPTATGSCTPGKELLAYVPRAVYGNLKNYADATYQHHFFVNATPAIGDLYDGDQWQTWLVGGEGAGGDSIFALNVTDPGSFDKRDVIGEWGPGNITCVNDANCGEDLGLTFGTPVITRFNDGKWGFVFGNGFNSSSGVASIFIAEVTSAGTVQFRELETGYGPANDPEEGANRPDGIAFVTSVDLNGDHSTDYVYAGDYFGNVWRFDLTSDTAADWGVTTYPGGGPLFSAVNANGTDQPITTKLLALAIPGAGGGPRVMIEFGTGAAVTTPQQAPNRSAAGVQTLYGVWDWKFDGWNTMKGNRGVRAFEYASLATGPSGNYSRNTTDLTEQSVLYEQTTQTVEGGVNNNRVISQTPVCWADVPAARLPNGCATAHQYGWYLDLVSPDKGKQGEKVVFNPRLRNGVFFVNTTIPSTSSGLTCQAAPQTGWTMAIDPANGGPLPFEVFDPTGNGKFEEVTVTDTDGTKRRYISSGITLGAVGSPGFITYQGGTWLITNTGEGKPAIRRLNIPAGNLAVQMSWQELR